MFGVLPIDKPSGLTSRDVVNRVQQIVRPVKVGHTGTLDPMATGVLLLALGGATRLVEFSHSLSKSYEAEFLLGRSSDTLDTEGQVKALDAPPAVKAEHFEREAVKWVGDVHQTPPKYSAINVDGQRAYDLARAGKEFQLKSRLVHIESIELLDFSYPQVRLQVRCGSGTYIRSLGSDIARGLGSDAVMSRLVRTGIGPFQLADCLALDAIRQESDVQAGIVSPLQLLASHATIRLSPEQTRLIRNGIPLPLESIESSDASDPNALASRYDEPIAAIDAQGSLVAVLAHRSGCLRSLRVFQV